MNSEDPPTSLPVTSASAPVIGRGYLALSIGAARYYAVSFAAFAMVLALAFEVVSYLISYATTFHTEKDWLEISSWLYRASDSIFEVQYVGRPPVLLLLALFVAPVALRMVYNINRGEALYKSGGRIARLWATPQEKAHWAYLQARLADAGVNRTSGARGRDVIATVVAVVASLAVIGLAYLAISGRASNTALGETITNLSVGYGPWVCLVVGLIGLVGSLAVLPLGRRVVIRADGSVEEPSRAV